MNKSSLSTGPVLSDLAHFAWCALVGLRLAQRDGQALLPLTAHAFLLRWLATAQKQRRFPRSVALDIECLLTLGRQKGPRAGLQGRLEYLWQTCSGDPSGQSDLYRLTHVTEHLKAQGWISAVVEDKAWEPVSLLEKYMGEQVLVARKKSLVRHFTDVGQLCGPVEFIVTGDVRVVMETLNSCELQYELQIPQTGWCVLTLQPQGG